MNTASKLLGRALLAPISWIPLSRLYGRLVRLQQPRWLAQRMIRGFLRRYRIDMEEFQGQAQDYRSLSEFFLRPLHPRTRPLRPDAGAVLSPADGRLSGLELVEGDAATQVKGWTYPLSRLLAIPVAAADRWHVATIYLSPADYHRFHYPVAGRITGCFHGGTRLFPVNDFSAKRVKRLYIRNERAVTRFAFGDCPLYMIAVGATFVGSIGLRFLEHGLPQSGAWSSCDIPVRQLEEMGHFAMGSTIILAVPAALVKSVLVEKGKRVRVGQPLFRLQGKTE